VSSGESTGTDSSSVVPPPPIERPPLLSSTQPPTVEARSCRPRMPKLCALARSPLPMPRPLSLISSDSTPRPSERSIAARVAPECLVTLVSASCAAR
jgi:hypothetical protein